MKQFGPDMDDFCWPQTDGRAVDESLCFHACRYVEAQSSFDAMYNDKIPYVVNSLERMYSCTKVLYKGWPADFKNFVMSGIEWNSSPGWPWRKHYPTNRDLFGFNGIDVLPERVMMVETAVRARWLELMDKPVSDPIFLFVKPEPHKKAKADKQSWRLISGVGLTDCLVDRILYGNWLDVMIEKHKSIPSKAGWAPNGGGYKWLAKSFRNKTPLSIDKSSWDWTVGAWHVKVLRSLLPRMIFKRDREWDKVFNNRFLACFGAGYPILKPTCGCEFVQLVDGIMKSGMLGTIGFNSIWQVANHLAVGGSEYDTIFSLGDDTVQEMVANIGSYIDKLRSLGCIIKEHDIGFPIVFGGHFVTEDYAIPAYKSKHMFLLKYLNEKVGPETLESYRHLYALDDVVSVFLESLALEKYGPSDLLSREYLRDWYKSLE